MSCPQLLHSLTIYIFSAIHRDEIFVGSSDSDSSSDNEVIPLFQTLDDRRREHAARRRRIVVSASNRTASSASTNNALATSRTALSAVSTRQTTRTAASTATARTLANDDIDHDGDNIGEADAQEDENIVPPLARQHNQPRDASARVPMHGFVYGRTSTGIRSDCRASALIRIIQIATAHPGGLIGSLGHGNRARWIENNRLVLFQAGGPLAAYNAISANVLQRDLADAEHEARSHYDRTHSNDRTGAEHEDIPRWVRSFFPLFQAQESQSSANALAIEVRRGRTAVVRSIVGAQAPLGHVQGDGIAELRSEISRNNRNNGTTQQSQRTAGTSHTLRMNEREFNDFLVEGRNDNENNRPAQRRRIASPRDGVSRQVVDISADRNDPVSRFADVRRGFESVNMLSTSLQHSWALRNAPLPLVHQPHSHILARKVDFMKRL